MLEEIKAKIADEIERLMHELTVTLPKAIQKAVELGDLSENAEYKSALERQEFVQARLNHLTQRANELSKIDPKALSPDRVGFGSRVQLKDQDTGELVEYSIVFALPLVLLLAVPYFGYALTGPINAADHRRRDRRPLNNS